jgi:demethylspheroidene O-methyltransferase
VTSAARRALERAGVLNRTSLYSGDFLTEALPTGADLITLIRILHDHDDVGVGHLLRSARAALADDGTLLVAEPMSDAPRRDRVSDVYFAFYLLAMGRGRTRTPREIRTLMRDAGFRRTRMLRTRTPFLLRAIIAHP